MKLELQHKQQIKHSKFIKKFDKVKINQVRFEVDSESLPQASSGVKDERKIQQYIDVLRKTHAKLGDELMISRIREKRMKRLLKKQKNPNFIKNDLYREKKKNSLRQKIREMRKEAIFPQQKSYMNYNHRVGLLKKNSINI